MSARLAKDVLSYWLSLLRHEEALVSSPKARRPLPAGQLVTPQLASPAPGQDYVKLPYAGSESLLVDKLGTLARPLEGEVVAFFEHWLHGQYRGSADERMQHLVCFPTLLLPRQELGGLLRFDVDVSWRDAKGKSFVLPSASERRRGATPPAALEVSATSVRGDGSAPFFVDHRLLRQVLCVDDERIEALGKAIEADPSPQHTVLALCQALHGQLQDDAASGAASGANDEDLAVPPTGSPSAELLSQVSRLTQLRLAQIRSPSRAFDTALLVNTGRNRATFHVQRDIQALLDADEIPEGPLSMYLSAARHTGGRAALLGRWPTAGVTTSQRDAAEAFLGSTLTAVQGPPGTGKTHMILNLAAHQLVENMARLAEKRAAPETFLLVTSTNNRAVDNVIEALNAEDQPATPGQGLALSLRVGSRDVIERVTVRQLEAALRQIERGGSATEQELAAQQRSFQAQQAKVQQLLEPHGLALQHIEARARQQSELAKLEQRTSPAPFDQLRRALEALTLQTDPTQVALNELGSPLGKLERRLVELSSMAETGKRAALVRLEQHFRHTQTTALVAVNEALGTSLTLPLPPTASGGSLQAQREAWEEAAETAIERVSTLRSAVDSTLRDQKSRARAETLREQLAASGLPLTAAGVDWQLVDAEQARLFDAALALRACWIRHHQRALSTALKKAIETCRSARSLRGARDADAAFGVWLRQLFPVWGCTLLSLGNNFDAEPGRLGRVVIDEAGQCHPAHVVSALLRARTALLVGDTHQLEPVIDLTRAQEKRVLQTSKLRSRAEQFERFRVYEGCNSSAQSLADAVVDERPTLIDHFRCQAEIVAISDQLCSYGLQVHTPRRSCVQLVPLLTHPVLFTEATGEQERFAGSWCNHAEVELVVAWLRALTHGGIGSDDIGIVTPFRGQNEVLWRRLRELGFRIAANSADVDAQESLFDRSNTGIALGTVHRFQGGERRIMLFSTTATRATTLPFLDARVNLVNVAASRAKEHLITIGDAALLHSGQHTRLLLTAARRVSPLG